MSRQLLTGGDAIRAPYRYSPVTENTSLGIFMAAWRAMQMKMETLRMKRVKRTFLEKYCERSEDGTASAEPLLDSDLAR